jgi:hypothetical protein
MKALSENRINIKSKGYIMFTTFEHFKKSSKIAYDSLRSNPKMKLNEFRQILGKLSSKSSLEAYQASFNNEDEPNTQSTLVTVTVIRDGIIEEMHSYTDSRNGFSEAEKCFREMMAHYLSNFDEYSEDDISDCIDEGIAKFGTGSIQLFNENTSYNQS